MFLNAINNLPHPEERPEGARLEGRNNDSAAIHSQALTPVGPAVASSPGGGYIGAAVGA